jgi:hypothetical protein
MISAGPAPSSLDQPPNRDMHREFALLQYNKSLKAMKDVIKETATNPRKVLVACLLVVCLENLLGNRYSAMSRAQVGHRILQDWLKSHPHALPHQSGISSPQSSSIEDDLVLVFGKLDLTIISHYDPRSINNHAASKQDSSITVAQIPITFTDLKEAKVFLDLVMRRAYHFIFYAFIKSDRQALS